MLIGTVVLLASTTLGFLLLEWSGSLASMPLWKRIAAVLFYAVSCRTAGFNTMDIAGLTNATLFLTVLLMLSAPGPLRPAADLKSRRWLCCSFTRGLDFAAPRE